MLNAKASEAVGLLDFFVQELGKTRFRWPELPKDRQLEAEFLLASGQAGLGFEKLLHDAPRVLPWETRRDLFTLFMRHTHLFHRAGGLLKPKHHLMVHMIQRCGVAGNPLTYHTYRDESLNGTIAKIARSCHRWTFGETTTGNLLFCKSWIRMWARTLEVTKNSSTHNPSSLSLSLSPICLPIDRCVLRGLFCVCKKY